MAKLEYENIKNESKEEIEVQIRYLSEENTDLRSKMRAGKEAEEMLTKNEIRLIELMDAYLETGETVVLSREKYEILKREMERADVLYDVQRNIKDLKGAIGWSHYSMKQEEIFKILDNIDKDIEEEIK